MEYSGKIDRLQQDSLDKDRALAQWQLKSERLGDGVERKRQEIEAAREASERERKVMGEKLEATKRKLSETQDEAMRAKLESGRESALMKQ